jgi:AraC-like DNA-binding protein
MLKRNPDNANVPVAGIAARYPVGNIAQHSHSRAQLVYAVSGVMTVLTEQGSWVLPPSRALWIPSEFKHWIKVSSAIELRTLYLAPKMRQLPNWRTCQVIGITPLLRELILLIIDLGWNYKSRGPDARLVQVLIDRLSAVRQEPVHLPEPADARARRFTSHMYENLADRRPLPEIAKDIGVSPRTLERLFENEVGMSVGAWTQQMRVVFALEMLASGKSVGDVAFNVGYQNPSSFIAVFRRIFAVTPTAYFTSITDTTITSR